MVKVYFSYEFDQTISQPISRQCNFVVLPHSNLFDKVEKVIVAGVNQYIAIIGMKTGEPIKYLFEN
jgi:hypothetical protein